MTKSELKPGYVVQFRNGELRMVMPTQKQYVLVAMKSECPFWSGLDNFDENLVNAYNDERTIVKVYGCSEFTTTIWGFERKHRKLLWERSEKKQYTYAQLREILGEEFEVVG